MHRKVFVRTMSTGYQALLIPSKEKLDLLQNVDLFSSFQDSSQEPIYVDTDSDDPFDPADLVGLETLRSSGGSFEGQKRMNSAASMPLNWLHSSPRQATSRRSSQLKGAQIVKRSPQHHRTPTKRRLVSPPSIYSTPQAEISDYESDLVEKLVDVTSAAMNQLNQGIGEVSALLNAVKSEADAPILKSESALDRAPMLEGLDTSKAKKSVSFNAMATQPGESSVDSKDVDTFKELNSNKRPWFMLLPKERTIKPPPAQNRQKSAPLNATIQLATQAVPNSLLSESAEKLVKPILLSQEQEYVRHLALQGKSMFFTGSAGTGKSVLLRQIIKDLKALHGPGTVAVTASTGLAAYHIGGITVHSFAGIGLGKGDLPALIKLVRRNRKVFRRWKDTKVLIIDEISMIDGRLFDNLDGIAREIRRKKNTPFGGIQVIVCGDFYQLPPVSKAQINPDGTELKEQSRFTFESEAWKNALTSSIILKQVFRQQGDQTFIDMLNDLRHGRVSEEAESEFRRLSRPLVCPDGIVPTELYSTRYEVENANNLKLVRLGGSTRVYEAKDGGSLPPAVKNAWLSNFLAPKKIFLKENAQVMCIKNFDDTLVNGSLGRVKGFIDRDTYLCQKIMDENPSMSLEETTKLFAKHRVAYSLSQKTNHDVLIDEITDDMLKAAPEQLDSVFNFLHEDKDFSQLLQNIDSNEGLPTGFDSSAPIEVNDVTDDELIRQNKRRKLDFISKVEEMAKGEKYPLVEFSSPDGLSSRTVLIEPERWDITDEATEEVLVSRVQLPLMLAWAMSIHKSQGQTLPKVKVDLSRIFENGHAYVALSRAVAREGLQVVNFKTEKVTTHGAVEKFYESLSTTEDLAKDHT